MDIGQAVEDEQYEWEVDAVSPNTQCYACGEYGHMSRNCPKGKGKGGKGGGKSWEPKGKGKGKGDGKNNVGKGAFHQNYMHNNYNQNPKGKGKGGYQGVCWKCNKVGHKAWECYAVEEGCEESEDANTEEV